VALVRDELLALLHSCRSRKVPLTVVGAERENEWHIYCDALEPFASHDFPVAYLSKEEVIDLLKKLEEHRALGLLAERTQEERVDAFLNRAERQLLVALHETTLGIPFETIVLDEYSRIKPREAQTLYLDIAALHQFGAPVRAGLVSRASGITFAEFGSRFLRPLADVVLVDEGKRPGDVFYRSRHQHVAELVFNQALPHPEDKYDLLANLIHAMNIDYSSDRETFSRLVRGRSVVGMFPNVELGRLLYDRAEEVAKNEHFVAHQRAVFELHHPNGELSTAEEAANRAALLNPNSHSVRHTQAEIARRQALKTADPLRKQSYRRVARERLSGDMTRLSEYDLYTRAKVAVDELRELVAKLGDSTNATALVAATREAETVIEKGRTEFPQSAEILAAEADLRDVLDQAPKALAALERAFSLNPRQDWLAVRLAKRYQAAGDHKKALEVIQRCLKDNPDSKVAHLQAAHLLRRSGGDKDRVLEHLHKAFVPGDNNFDGQFWHARELYLRGRSTEAKTLFDGVNERAPGRFRTESAAEYSNADGSPISLDGSILRKEEGYAFVRLIDLGVDVFSSRADSARIDWDRIRTGSQVRCYVAFNRRGARATHLTVRHI
jgi:tetratricopeptide (TPR) repeat protein